MFEDNIDVFMVGDFLDCFVEFLIFVYVIVEVGIIDGWKLVLVIEVFLI